VDDAVCAFPECGAARDEGDLSLCHEHRALLLDDPGEFRRRWGALDPRPGGARPYLPRRAGGTAAEPDPG